MLNVIFMQFIIYYTIKLLLIVVRGQRPNNPRPWIKHFKTVGRRQLRSHATTRERSARRLSL